MIRLWLRADRAGTPIADRPGLRHIHPDLAAQVDPDRHPDVDLDRLTAGSRRWLWWRCPAGHGWEARVASRTAGAGCPVCAGRYPAGIATTHPALAAQVDRLRHPPLDLDRVTAGSERKLWWRCPAGHVWPAQVKARTAGQGCPVCAGQRPGPLAATHPALAAELHPTRNPDVTAHTVHAGSHGLLWWRCREGHEWEDTPARRARGAACPTCDPGPTRSRRRLYAHVYSDPADPGPAPAAAAPPSPTANGAPPTRPTGRPAAPPPPEPDAAVPAPPGPATPPAPPRTALPKSPPAVARLSKPAGQGRARCPVCDRSIATFPPRHEGDPLLLRPHRDASGQRCSGRVVTDAP